MKIVHHNDADGKCAAAIIYQYTQINKIYNPEFIEMDYAKEFPLKNIQTGEYIAIVDFSLKPEVMNKLIEITKNIVWIDHHKTAETYKYTIELMGERSFVNKGLAGCELTWKYYYPNIPIPNVVKLIGDYDSWRLELAPKSLEFFEGLKMINHNPKLEVWKELLTSDDKINDIIKTGKVAIKYRDMYCEDICKSYGFETDFDGYKTFVTNIYRFGSQGFGERMKSYDICASCIYNGQMWTISLYSEKSNIDVGKICQKHNGGGHKGAAGFTSKEFPFKLKII